MKSVEYTCSTKANADMFSTHIFQLVVFLCVCARTFIRISAIYPDPLLTVVKKEISDLSQLILTSVSPED